MNRYPYRTSLFFILFGVLVGCGGNNYSSVSGLVTMDGKPVAGVTLVFTPVGSVENSSPGPYSTGVTDDQGVFTLKTRHGNTGAVPGPHRVGIEYAKAGEMSDLTAQLHEADEESRPAIQQQIDALRASIKSRIKIPANFIQEYSVPEKGTSNASFELNSQ